MYGISVSEKNNYNTPGTRGGPGGHDRALAIKEEKSPENQLFFVKNLNYLKQILFFCIYLLVMPK